jgi:hypothetical protein
MKKIFLFMLASLIIFSFSNCSGDSDSKSTTVPNSTKSVSLKVDGVQKIFSRVDITQEAWSDDGVPKVDLTIVATNPENDGEYIVFGIGKGDIGENQLWNFVYVNEDIEYIPGETELSSATTINIEKRLQGTFSGSVTSDGNNHVLSDGIFDITY